MSMKTLHIATALAALGAASVLGAATSSATPPVTVVFDHPEKFTDVKDSMLGSDEGRDAILAQIRGYFVEKASAALPQGYQATFTFTDVDLAGEYEPWHGPQWNDVRVVRSIYPPAFAFSYVVTDASGKVVKKGSEHLREMGFEFHTTLDVTDPLRYEKCALRDWVDSNLRQINKS
jgi:Protein of unknown function (DUF3016)